MSVQVEELILDDATLSGGAVIKAAGGGLPRRITTHRAVWDGDDVAGGDGTGIRIGVAGPGLAFSAGGRLYVMADTIGGGRRVVEVDVGDGSTANQLETGFARVTSGLVVVGSEVFAGRPHTNRVNVYDLDLTAQQREMTNAAFGDLRGLDKSNGDLIAMSRSPFQIFRLSTADAAVIEAGAVLTTLNHNFIIAAPDGASAAITGVSEIGGHEVRAVDLGSGVLGDTLFDFNALGGPGLNYTNVAFAVAWDPVSDRIWWAGGAVNSDTGEFSYHRATPVGVDELVTTAGRQARAAMAPTMAFSPLVGGVDQWVAWVYVPEGNDIVQNGDGGVAVRRKNAQKARFSRTFDAGSFPDGVTIKAVGVPGALPEQPPLIQGADALQETTPVRFFYEIDAGGRVEFEPGQGNLEIVLAAGETLHVDIELRDWLPAHQQPYIGGDAGEGIYLIYDDPAATNFVLTPIADISGSMAITNTTGGSIERIEP